MKKSTPSVAFVSSASSWRMIALVSLLANAGLAGWAWRAATKSATPNVPASAATATVPTAHETLAGPRVRPKGPYAALGSYMAENNRIADLGWTPAQFDAFLDGFRASYEGRGLPLDDDAKTLRDDISARVQKMLAKEQPDPAEDYFRMLRDKEGVKQTASGLHYRITNEGSGLPPKPGDTVVMSFAVRQPDGKELPELGRERVRVAVRDLLPGLAEGVQLMSVGAKALVYLPAALSFSPDNWPAAVPRGMPLAFFVELHEIVPPGGEAGFGR